MAAFSGEEPAPSSGSRSDSSAESGERVSLLNEIEDPLRLLTELKVNVPDKTVTSLKNLDDFARLYFQDTGIKVDHTVQYDKPKDSGDTIKKKKKAQPNVLSEMKKRGPFDTLYKSVNDKIRVKVLIRNQRKPRSFCTGYVVAYDRHMNLAMVDVDEVVCSRRVRIPCLGSVSKVPAEGDPGPASRRGPRTPPGSSPSSSDDATTPQSSEGSVDSGGDEPDPPGVVKYSKYKNSVKLLPKGRHINQLFIRGDSIVQIALAPVTS